MHSLLSLWLSTSLGTSQKRFKSLREHLQHRDQGKD